jgi:hypothetical protein
LLSPAVTERSSRPHCRNQCCHTSRSASIHWAFRGSSIDYRWYLMGFLCQIRSVVKIRGMMYSRKTVSGLNGVLVLAFGRKATRAQTRQTRLDDLAGHTNQCAYSKSFAPFRCLSCANCSMKAEKRNHGDSVHLQSRSAVAGWSHRRSLERPNSYLAI